MAKQKTVGSVGSKLFQGILSTVEKWVVASPMLFTVGMVVVGIIFLGTVLLTISSGWAAVVDFFTGTRAMITDSSTLISGIKPLGQFVSISYQEASINNKIDIRDGVLNACNQSAEYAFVVEIKAGTDLTKLEAEDISVDEANQTYTITLPNPILTNCNVYGNFDRYAERYPLGCPSYERDMDALGAYQIVEDMREKALSEGILEDAKRENEETLAKFFEGLGGKQVIFRYRDGSPAHDASCTPKLPEQWGKNVDPNGVVYWTRKS